MPIQLFSGQKAKNENIKMYARRVSFFYCKCSGCVFGVVNIYILKLNMAKYE